MVAILDIILNFDTFEKNYVFIGFLDIEHIHLDMFLLREFLYHLAIKIGLYNILMLWQPSCQTEDGSIEKGRPDDRPLQRLACY